MQMKNSGKVVAVERVEDTIRDPIQIDLVGPKVSLADYGGLLDPYEHIRLTCGLYPESFVPVLVGRLHYGQSWRRIANDVTFMDRSSGMRKPLGKEVQIFTTYCLAWLLVAQDKLEALDVPRWPGRPLCLELAAAQGIQGLGSGDDLMEAAAEGSTLQITAGSSAQQSASSGVSMELIRITSPDGLIDEHSAMEYHQTKAAWRREVTKVIVRHWQLQSLEAMEDIRNFTSAHMLSRRDGFAFVGAVLDAARDIDAQCDLLLAEIDNLGCLVSEADDL